MYQETLYEKTKQVLELTSTKDAITSKFYLAGGTALALQLGHRKSVDLDFFTNKFPKRDLLLASLNKFNPTITNEAEGTLDLLIDDIKVSFLEYDYPLLKDFEEFNNINIASIIDIACMKITAISSRGSKKDFVDLNEILNQFSLEEIFNNFEKKYLNVSYQKAHLLKSLIYFNDANNDPEPDYLKHRSWKNIKSNLEIKVKEYLK